MATDPSVTLIGVIGAGTMGAGIAQVAAQAGFENVSLYGDYDESRFDATSSPFMIWRFRRRTP